MDTAISFWVHDHLPDISVFSQLGSSETILFLVVIITIFLISTAQLHKAYILLLLAISSSLTSYAIKNIIGRARPNLWPPVEIVTSHSFPSGHTLVSVSVYGVISIFLAERYPRFRYVIYGIFIMLALAIGTSRIQMGVHWPSDVLGGWLIGGLILWLMSLWYYKGSVGRTIRVGIGIVVLLLGIIGLIIPLIPGIPLIIGGVFLIISNRSLVEIFKAKKKKGEQA